METTFLSSERHFISLKQLLPLASSFFLIEFTFSEGGRQYLVLETHFFVLEKISFH